jgi:centromere/kinetochore protein ZW10
MAASTQETAPEQIAQALVEFTVRGAFPEETVSSLQIGPKVLAPAIEALAEAKSKLQVTPNELPGHNISLTLL